MTTVTTTIDTHEPVAAMPDSLDLAAASALMYEGVETPSGREEMVRAALTQLRTRREHLEAELRTARLDERELDADQLRQWAYEQAEGLAASIDGKRDPHLRRVVANYVDEIRIFPETKTGELVVNGNFCGLIDAPNDNDRPEGRSCGAAIVCAQLH